MNYKNLQQKETMKKEESKVNYQSQTGSTISSIFQLKLRESSFNPDLKQPNDPKHHKGIRSILNTPSTVDNIKKYYSCEMGKNSNNLAFHPLSSQVRQMPRRCQSATKILSLRQIKTVAKKDEQFKQERIRIQNSPSRKIFVSISKQNSQKSLGKKKGQVDFKEDELKQISFGKEKKQKIKINIYRDIARKNKHISS